jgi:hypothetical protein
VYTLHTAGAVSAVVMCFPTHTHTHTHKYVSEFRNRHVVVMVLRVCCQVALLAGGSDHGVIKVTVIRTYHGVAVRQKVS